MRRESRCEATGQPKPYTAYDHWKLVIKHIKEEPQRYLQQELITSDPYILKLTAIVGLVWELRRGA